MTITDLNRTFITSDHHFNDTRFDALYRSSLVTSKVDHIDFLIKCWNNVVQPEDTVIHLGDVSVDAEGYKHVNDLNGNIHLIKGNHDERHDDEYLSKFFDSVQEEMIIEVENYKLYANHYPKKGRRDLFNLVGHVHGLWKLQKNMLNVGVDCWHFKPVSFNQILFALNATKKYYDDNIFAGQLSVNRECAL